MTSMNGTRTVLPVLSKGDDKAHETAPSPSLHAGKAASGSSAVSGADQQTRKRRFHTRSRRGCLTCKQRRVKCDEQQPICGKCMLSKRDCQYDVEHGAVKDLRVQHNVVPGMWIWQVSKLDSLDPFDAFPVEMKLRSRELFHYFTGTEWHGDLHHRPHEDLRLMQQRPGPQPGDLGLPDSIRWSFKDPLSFRITLLVAGMHYVWRTGRLLDFEETHWSHKADVIRRVNTCLVDRSMRTSIDCMRMICILAASECCTGNIRGAMAHLDGFLALMEMREQDSTWQEDGQENELAERLFLTTCCFTMCTRDRAGSSTSLPATVPGVWHLNFTELPDNLSAMRLFPFYFNTTILKDQKYRDIDATPAIEALRGMADTVKRHGHPGRSHQLLDPSCRPAVNICTGSDSKDCLGCKSMVALFLSNTRTHVESLLPSKSRSNSVISDTINGSASSETTDYRDGEEELLLRSSWRGLVVSEMFFLSSVLGIVVEEGRVTELAVFRRFLSMLRRDIDQTADQVLHSTAKPAEHGLWFWKVFVAACTIHMVTSITPDKKGLAARGLLKGAKGFVADGEWAAAHVKRWAVFSGVVEWDEARAALMGIVWANTGIGDTGARAIWLQATVGLEKKTRLFPKG